jgi:hypothetical protein
MMRRHHWLAFGLALAWPGALACNMVTGADKLVLVDDDDSTSSSSGVSVTGPGAGPAVGAGGMTSGAGGATASNGATSGAGASPTNCQYPAGPYGVAQGQTLPPSLSWQGYAPGGSQPVTVTVQDFFDCDGTRGIHAVLFDTAQFG